MCLWWASPRIKHGGHDRRSEQTGRLASETICDMDPVHTSLEMTTTVFNIQTTSVAILPLRHDKDGKDHTVSIKAGETLSLTTLTTTPNLIALTLDRSFALANTSSKIQRQKGPSAWRPRPSFMINDPTSLSFGDASRWRAR